MWSQPGYDLLLMTTGRAGRRLALCSATFVGMACRLAAAAVPIAASEPGRRWTS
jgi:hypothetical protein